MIMKKIIIFAGLALLSIYAVISMTQTTSSMVNAPDFPKGAQWLNSAPLTMKDLRGKIVLLDFWTYCCINCMHILPDLEKLEDKYADELVIVGVHSAKFKNEKDTDNIRSAILRYGIKHPVINDKNFELWYELGVRAWPTLVLIDPQGKVVTMRSGEGVFAPFDKLIGDLVTQFNARGLLDHTPLKLQPEIALISPDGLAFPGKIAVDQNTGRLFISDSNHNRVVVTDINGRVLQVIGGADSGFDDGDFQSARFRHPQGIYYDAGSDIIYVADTENHAIRQIDMKNKRVRTIAGNGHQALGFNQEGKGEEISLNSPWDLTEVGDKLYIAMAGSHQVWTLDLITNDARVYAGTGQEDIIDGPRKAAALAQTSGITYDGDRYLYTADSEVSAVRRIGLGDNARVETIIGQGLFDFGDKDGKYPEARLQHPIGVTYYDGFVYVADTYNHKIKKIDPEKKEVHTLIGTGERGNKDGQASRAELDEPNGLVFAGGKLYIADTDNHLIKTYDPATDMVSTLTITGLGEYASGESNGDSFQGELKKYSPVEITPAVKNLDIQIELPRGMKFNNKAPFSIDVTSDNQQSVKIEKFKLDKATRTLQVPIMAGSGDALVTVLLYFGYCNEGNEGLCYFKDLKFEIPVKVTKQGLDKLNVNYEVIS